MCLSAVIACRPSFPPYLAALNPTDQVFDFEELEYHYLVANRTEDAPSKEDDDDDDDDDNIKPEKVESEEKLADESPVGGDPVNSPTIDNPYLRAAKVPKRTKGDGNA